MASSEPSACANQGDFAYPLDLRGRDEVSALTAAFHRMRQKLQDAQRQLLDAERLATIGRMASTISHDLRHPLTAILAYAEFLAEPHLSEAQRKDYLDEIRIAVNRMTDEVNSLLGFSKEREAIRPVLGPINDVIARAVKTTTVLPEFAGITITVHDDGEYVAWCDPGKQHGGDVCIERTGPDGTTVRLSFPPPGNRANETRGAGHDRVD